MNYGYGLMKGELAGHTLIAHGGGIPGFNTHMTYYPAEGIGIVVLVNTSPGQPARIEQAVARAALGLPRVVIADLPLTASERSRYTGNYDLGQLRVHVFERDGVLMAQATNQSALRMKYQGAHTFLLDAPQAIKLVFELDGDRATRFTLHQNGAVVPATRMGRSL
jgi:hypothetical protein